ncbi:radical SAM/SPASM domain-containing protein [Streptomyces spectabilis]|uniref:Radical SAM/SPASM domain-containing protein n=1 Tax=Streptomyces spectabilis TaxID=68270 RepID=A0A516R905_STRST|nr:radical SAM/SPASM domain-containing protein [Streptomyces spectabilis]QDQ12149.1 radical SAM/SPASM domain-containing protein [Streptomyces spectabilis]
MTTVARPTALDSIDLEITGGCQLTCTHCFADSSPRGTHGKMTVGDWRQVIVDASTLGIRKLQLIGGEPTLHPQWEDLLDLALDLNMRVELFSNLFYIHPSWWAVLRQDGVSLATSYYSDDPDEHDKITNRTGSYLRTRANIEQALKHGIPLRAGIVQVHAGQRTDEARAELEALGVTDIDFDHVRAFGRAAGGAAPNPANLCGRCGRTRAAVLPSGDVSLCVLARFMPVGNVRVAPLAEIIDNPAWRHALEQIPEVQTGGCSPDDQSCQPGQPACLPKFPNTPDGPR